MNEEYRYVDPLLYNYTTITNKLLHSVLCRIFSDRASLRRIPAFIGNQHSLFVCM